MGLALAVLRFGALVVLTGSLAACAGLSSQSAGLGTGEGRHQACKQACSAAAPDTPAASCEACSCDKLAGGPAICTTRRRLP